MFQPRVQPRRMLASLATISQMLQRRHAFPLVQATMSTTMPLLFKLNAQRGHTSPTFRVWAVSMQILAILLEQMHPLFNPYVSSVHINRTQGSLPALILMLGDLSTQPVPHRNICGVGAYQPMRAQSNCVMMGHFVNISEPVLKHHAMLVTINQTLVATRVFSQVQGIMSTPTVHFHKPCAVGTYQPFAGYSSCFDSEPDIMSYNRQFRKTNALPGPSKQTGQSACNLSTPGHFVNINKSTTEFLVRWVPTNPIRQFELHNCDAGILTYRINQYLLTRTLHGLRWFTSQLKWSWLLPTKLRQHRLLECNFRIFRIILALSNACTAWPLC